MSWEGEKGTQDKETLKKTEDTAIVAKKNFKAIKYNLKKRKMSHTGKFRNNSHPKAIINLQLLKWTKEKHYYLESPFSKKIASKP